MLNDEFIHYDDSVEMKQPNENQLIDEISASIARVNWHVFDKHRHAVRNAHAKSHSALKGEDPGVCVNGGASRCGWRWRRSRAAGAVGAAVGGGVVDASIASLVSPEYKLAIVAEYENAPNGEKGAILRREGLYSSHVIEWTRARDAGVRSLLVAHAEDAVVAKDFLADAVARNLVIPHTIHADRGGSMTSKPVSEMMIDLGIRRSHSRPRTSNDNPFSPGAVQDPQIRSRLPRPVRFTRRRTRVLRPVLPRLQPRTPPLRNRHAHPSLSPLRNRNRDPRTTPGHPRPRPRTTPRAVQPPAPPTVPARAGVDQPTHPATANPVRSTVSFDLTATAAERTIIGYSRLPDLAVEDCVT